MKIDDSWDIMITENYLQSINQVLHYIEIIVVSITGIIWK